MKTRNTINDRTSDFDATAVAGAAGAAVFKALRCSCVKLQHVVTSLLQASGRKSG
jgi:hypothetical protein